MKYWYFMGGIDEPAEVDPDTRAFTLRFSRRLIRTFVLFGVVGVAMAAGCTVLAVVLRQRDMIPVGILVLVLSVGLLVIAAVARLWRCVVAPNRLCVQCSFYKKEILWSSVRSAKWLISRSRYGVSDYTLVLFDERKKLIDVNASVSGIMQLKKMVKRRHIPLREKPFSLRNLYRPEA